MKTGSVPNRELKSSAPSNYLLILVSWIIPGAGFWARGRVARGTTQFLLVMITFALGLFLHGGVAWPSWSTRAQDFNVINNFTFIVQMCAGLPALVSLAANRMGWNPLGGILWDTYFELGGYFLIVAGAINYFAVCNFYDRAIKVHARFAAQEEEAPPKTP